MSTRNVSTRRDSLYAITNMVMAAGQKARTEAAHRVALQAVATIIRDHVLTAPELAAATGYLNRIHDLVIDAERELHRCEVAFLQSQPTDPVGALDVGTYASQVRATSNPMAALPWAPSFTPPYSVIRGAVRYWRGKSGRVYTDRDGWFRHDSLPDRIGAKAVWFFDGPMTEVSREEAGR